MKTSDSMKPTNPHLQEAQQTISKINIKKIVSNIIRYNQNEEYQWKREDINSARGKIYFLQDNSKNDGKFPIRNFAGQKMLC